MDVHNKRMFRVLACCELMQTDHYFDQRTKHGFVRRLVKGDRLRFLTMTVPENDLPLRTVAARFRAFANSRWWRDLTRLRSYICVYEPHPHGHGWHIHILCNFYIPWRELDLVCRSYLFGHTDIEAAQSSCATYIAKYVTKSQMLKRAQEARHVRIVNVSRDLLPLRDIDTSSNSIDYIKVNWERSSLPASCRLRFLYYHWVHSWSGRFLPYAREYEKEFESLPLQYKSGCASGGLTC